MTSSSKFALASYANRSKEFREAVQRVRKRQHELQEILKAEHEESGEEASDEQVWSLKSLANHLSVQVKLPILKRTLKSSC